MILGVTGHRPKYLTIGPLDGYHEYVQKRLRDLARQVLLDTRPSCVLTGMALGWDIAVAESAKNLDVPYAAYVPFPGQELLWTQPDQDRYNALLSTAQEVKYISARSHRGAYLRRNTALVKDSQALAALWNGSLTSGTAHAIHQARIYRVPLRNYWNSWERHKADEALTEWHQLTA